MKSRNPAETAGADGVADLHRRAANRQRLGAPNGAVDLHWETPKVLNPLQSAGMVGRVVPRPPYRAVHNISVAFDACKCYYSPRFEER